MGEVQIAKAYECLKKNDIQGGFLNLSHGVARNPDDLAKIEILLSQKDAREATTLLESLKYSDHVKANKLEPLLEGLNLITKALSRNDVFNSIDTFVLTHQASELISLSKMFYKLG